MSLLDTIIRGKSNAPRRTVIYGTSGIGKTTLAAQAPKPIFLPTEDGFGELEVARFPVIQSWHDFVDCLDAIAIEQHDYKTLVVDTADKLEKVLWAHVCSNQGWQSIEDPGFGKGYVLAANYWHRLTARLDQIREQKQMHIILLAHAQIRSFTPPEQGLNPYDTYLLDLHKNAAQALKDWCDTLVFINYEVTNSKDNRKNTKGVGQGHRIVNTEERPAFWAKNRFGFPATLPLEKNTIELLLGDNKNATTTQ